MYMAYLLSSHELTFFKQELSYIYIIICTCNCSKNIRIHIKYKMDAIISAVYTVHTHDTTHVVQSHTHICG